MKRFTALATSLVAAGSILLPTAASASPWVTATSNGNPVDGTTGQPGTPILIGREVPRVSPSFGTDPSSICV